MERARLLLQLADGVLPKDLAQESDTPITTVYRLLNKALELGVVAALDDLQRSGRPADIKPHKIRYYLERRDPDFDEKMAQALVMVQQAEWTLAQGTPDLPPQPGKHPCVGRDYEYVRHGTLSVLAGIDLVTGTVIGTVEDRRRSQEFVAFLQSVPNRFEFVFTPKHASRQPVRIS